MSVRNRINELTKIVAEESQRVAPPGIIRVTAVMRSEAIVRYLEESEQKAARRQAMADRTAAELFGMIFEGLAERPDEINQKLAQKIYAKARDFDFKDYQMYCDPALRKLGIPAKLDDE